VSYSPRVKYLQDTLDEARRSGYYALRCRDYMLERVLQDLGHLTLESNDRVCEGETRLTFKYNNAMKQYFQKQIEDKKREEDEWASLQKSY